MTGIRKYWAFDLDGTLVDSFGLYFSALSKVFADHGAQFTDDLRLPALTEPLPQLFDRCLGKTVTPVALSALESQSAEDASNTRTFEGIIPAIRALADDGARISVCTNRDLFSAQLILKHSGLAQFIELCVSGTCVSERKPHPEGLLRIANHFGCAPHAVAVVGDHEHDMLAAKGAGAKAIRASWHSYWEVAPCDHSDLQFHSVAAFAEWSRHG